MEFPHRFGFAWPSDLREKNHLHVFSTGAKTDNSLWSVVFHEHKSFVNLVIFSKVVFPLNDFVSVFSIQAHRRPNLTLRLKESRSTQRHYSYKLRSACIPNAAWQVSRS